VFIGHYSLSPGVFCGVVCESISIILQVCIQKLEQVYCSHATLLKSQQQIKIVQTHNI